MIADQLIHSYLSFISEPRFACVAAKAAHAHKQIKCFAATDMRSNANDTQILQFIYDFIDEYRSVRSLYHSATVIFELPQIETEEQFDELLWQRLQSLSDLDAKIHNYDKRVSANPASPNFSYSLKEEAFFIVGLHPGSDRRSRRFTYPTLVFNPHAEFEKLRAQGRYEKMK